MATTRETAMISNETQMHQAYDAIKNVLGVIDQNAEALALTPIGRSWMDDAEAMKGLIRDAA